MISRRGLLFAPVRYRTYAHGWPDWMRRQVQQAYDLREKALATTPPKDRQRYVRQTFWKLIGGEPERTPLNLRTTGEFERPGYRLEKIVFESFPGVVIPANLYIPRDVNGPYPGVLFHMGHALNGKAYDSYQRCCQALARQGYLVLAFDPMGQGERTYYPRIGGTLTRLGSADDEHTLPGQQMLLVNDTATRLQTWDAVRALDVLAAHPQVDPRRLASTGQSGGGTVTMFLTAVDDRLACAAVSSGNTENFACRNFNPPGSTDDAEQNLIASAPTGIDRWDLLYPMAPKPLLIAASARDFFGTYSVNYLENGREEFAKLERFYARAGAAAGRVQWVENPLPHSLSEPMRMEIYHWFNRWLKGEARPVLTEPPTAPEPEERLWTGRTGNVVRDFSSRTPLDLVRARLPQTNPNAKPDWPKLLNLPPIAAAPVTRLSQTRLAGVTVDAIEVASEPGLWLPAYLYSPLMPNHKLLLMLDGAGRAARWMEGGLYHQLALRGYTVCAADLRGLGDLAPELPRGPARHAMPHAQEDHWAWASLTLGRPLAGQRAADVLALVKSLQADATLGRCALTVAAQGRALVPALLAHAIDPRWPLHLGSEVPNLRRLAQSEEYSEPAASFVPGLLLEGDFSHATGAGVHFTRWDTDLLARL